MSTALGILGVLAFLVFIFFAVIAIIHKVKSKDDCKVQLKKAAICFIASIALIGAGMAAQTPEERAANEQARLERIAKEQAEEAEKEAKEQAEKEAKEKAEAEAKAQQEAEKQKPSTVNLDVTEQNKQDKAALEEYITSALGGKYRVENLSTSTYPTDNGDTYGVFFDINKKYTDEQARDEARKIRDMLNAFPVPIDAVHITFKGVPTISYAPGNPEFVQVSGGQRTTFK